MDGVSEDALWLMRVENMSSWFSTLGDFADFHIRGELGIFSPCGSVTRPS